MSQAEADDVGGDNGDETVVLPTTSLGEVGEVSEDVGVVVVARSMAIMLSNLLRVGFMAATAPT